jgi:signal transduction histidine kinase
MTNNPNQQQDRVLIIDDEISILSFMEHVLLTSGFDVITARDGELGIEKAQNAKPDIILLDVRMPGISGFETCHRLKMSESTANIPIIFLTVLIKIEDKLQGFEAGGVDYILKPVEPAELVIRLKTHLTLRKLQHVNHQNEQLKQEIAKRQQVEKELRKSKDLAESANRAKSEFLAAMSHELRTPLNSIIVFSELLQDNIQGALNEEQGKAVGHIEKAGTHLLSLINDILLLSNIEAEQLELQIESVQVNTLCKNSLQQVSSIAQKKQIRLFKTTDDIVKNLQADETFLKKILIHLLTNAIKFTPEGGQVTLEIRGDEKDVVQFSVIDTGIGIPEKEIDRLRLLQPFVQLDGRLSRKYEGVGLGLSLVYRLTKLHSGSVNIESELGKGSKFTVSLPWQDSETVPTFSE